LDIELSNQNSNESSGPKDFQQNLQDICLALELSEEILKQAIELLEEYRGHFKPNDQHLPPAAIHVASRIKGQPRTQKMIVDYLRNEDHLFSSSADNLERRIRENVKKLRKMPDIDVPVVRSKDYLEYISSQLHFDPSKRVLEAAKAYCIVVESRPGMSRSKAAVAGACLKAAVEDTGRKHTVTHDELAQVTGMNEKTFKDNLIDIRENIIKPAKN